MSESDAEFSDRVIAEARAKAGVDGRAQLAEYQARLAEAARTGGIGAPPDWEATKREVLEQTAAAEASARAVLTERVAEALADSDTGQDAIPWDELSDYGKDQQRVMAAAAVQVFAAWLRNPLGRPTDGPWVSWGGDGVGP